MLNATELRAGATFKDSQGIWEVVKYTHTKMGRGSATIRLKVKNLKSGAVVERTFTSSQKVDELALTKKRGQYLYGDGKDLVFMDQKSFEQFNLPKSTVGEKEKFLKEGENYEILTTDDQILNVEIPRNMVLKVCEAAPGVKGDSVSAATKDATLENGVIVKVPLFINTGDSLRVDTRTGEYLERVR